MKKIIKKIISILSESRKWTKASGLIFLLSVFLGAVTFVLRDLPTFAIVSDSLDKIASLSNMAKDFNFLERFFLIYGNNLLSMIIIMLGGLLLGIASLFGIFTNGLILGFFFFLLMSADLPFFSRLFLIFMIIPHGIIEISLLIIAGGWGLKLGFEYFLPESKGKRLKVFKNNIKNSFWIIILMLIGLAFAAVIEVLGMKIIEILVI